MRFFVSIFFSFLVISCDDRMDNEIAILSEYLSQNSDLERADLVACAGGRPDGFLGTAAEPTDIIYYPIEGAVNVRCFETELISDVLDYSTYTEVILESENLFNGYLEKFNSPEFDGEKMAVVTYETPGKIHVSNPIRLKTNSLPTEVNVTEVTINTEEGLMPSFSWTDGSIDENIIYFHVVSDDSGNLISGTYTVEKEFTFYNLSNVVFNITDPSFSPALEPNQDYTFTLMGVSEDNWVNLFIEQDFTTD